MRYLITVFAAFVLSGCATNQSHVPVEMLQCEPQPISPAADASATQRDVALYVIDLASAGEDCRYRLGAVRQILYPE